MTYNEAMSIIKNPEELNALDALYGPSQEGDNGIGYRIYTVDKKGYRHSVTRPTAPAIDEPLEHNSYYWNNKEIAKAYMVYLADALPQYTYGLYKAEVVKGKQESPYNYGQVASQLHIIDESMIQVLTPDMTEEARNNPDRQLFS